jgi:DNA-binding XRE family transcriptional regulator
VGGFVNPAQAFNICSLLINLQPCTIFNTDQAKVRKPMFLDSIFRYCKQQSKGLTGASAADELGISASSFNAFLNWRVTGKFPSIDTMLKIAQYIDWEFDDVFIAVNSARFELMAIDSNLEKQIKPPEFKPQKVRA